MSPNTDPAAVIDTLSGVPLLLLAAWLAKLGLARRHGRGPILALAVYVAVWAYTAIAFNAVTIDDPLVIPISAAWLPLLAGQIGALAILAASFPRPFGPADRPPMAIAAALAGVAAAAGQAPLLLEGPGVVFRQYGLETAPSWLVWGSWILSSIGAAAFTTFVLFLAVRAARGALPAPALAQDALLAGALALLVGYNQGYWSLAPEALIRLPAVATVAAFGAAGAFWLRAAGAREGRPARIARNVGLLYFAVPAAGMAVTVLLGGYAAAGFGPFGLVRMLAVLVLVYAILRHELLGLDVRVRWTVKQSTLAAAFIGVFFVVSESASTFFASEGGLGPYLGIGAAGVLVFALAPLQRAAERVASAAVPVAGADARSSLAGPRGGASPREAGREATFREAARYALADRSLTRREERHLAQLAEHLGIGAARALALREQVEEELASQAPSPSPGRAPP